MKKTILLLLCLSLVSALFTGCHSTHAPTSTTSPTVTAAEDPTTTAPEIPTGTALGDKIPDLTFTDSDGDPISLYSLLEEKQLVVLNFWFEDCPWCLREFPVMELTYQQYRENVEILALNPFDPQEAVSAFPEAHSLSFPMLSCPQELPYAFGVSGYPTSVFIDREGIISLIIPGAVTDSNVFHKLFQVYTAEDYTSTVYPDINAFMESA